MATKPRFIILLEFVPLEMTRENQERFLKWRESQSIQALNFFRSVHEETKTPMPKELDQRLLDGMVTGTPGWWKVKLVSGPSKLGPLKFHYPRSLRFPTFDPNPNAWYIILEEDKNVWEGMSEELDLELMNADIFDGFDIEIWQAKSDQSKHLTTIVDGEHNI